MLLYFECEIKANSHCLCLALLRVTTARRSLGLPTAPIGRQAQSTRESRFRQLGLHGLNQFASVPAHTAQQHHFQHAMGSMFVLYAHKAAAWVECIADLTPEREQPCKDTGKFESRPFSEFVLNNTPYGQRSEVGVLHKFNGPVRQYTCLTLRR